MLMFRQTPGGIEVLLAHPGGPFYVNRDLGAWTLPKGLIDEGEDPLAAAIREFREETGISAHPPFLELGEVRQKSGKYVVAWAFEGDADAASITSNVTTLEWPRGSGRFHTFPEIDRCAWFTLAEARQRIIPAQGAMLDRLERLVGGRGG
jgi:predicted NUDIX family NTP pyrophosphohydrolase